MHSSSIINYIIPGTLQWPDAQVANSVASEVSVAPTVEPWSLPAVIEKAAATGLSTTLESSPSLPSTSVRPGNYASNTQPGATVDLDTPNTTARDGHTARGVFTR